MTTNQTKAGQKNSANRLIEEVSTYLKQHAYNPVNWYPWSKEALDLSIATDKPIMLSIGYSACHWCHVMEEECFEDETTAKLINDHFIPIKVDREERPDLDDIYMTAVQIMTGQGGWPLTVFLTPQQKPFYGGTYFPREDRRHGNHILPGFKTVLKSISHAWQKNRVDIEANCEELTNAITSIAEQHTNNQNSTQQGSDSNYLVECAKKLLPSFDLTWGGIGRAPKFPQTLSLQMCLQACAKLKKQKDKQITNELYQAVHVSLERMARGGMYDQLGGGFARYSTDEQWLIPHFEKMLYDNALLAETYLDAFTFDKKELWKTIACETLDFIATELTSEEGGFYSSLDADSEGVEGKFYVWKKSEIEQILGSRSELFCKFFGVTENGNFENKENILNTIHNSQFEEQSNEIKDLKTTLLTHRKQKIHPIRDEKILTSWTSLAISAFIKGYRATGSDKYLSSAKEGAHFILSKLVVKEQLKRSYARGIAKLDAYLDDYAFFCKSLIDLASVDSNPIWLDKALHYGDLMIEMFFDEESKDFFYTANSHEKLITRPKNYSDGPIPSSTSVAVWVLSKLYQITNEIKYKTVNQYILDKYKRLSLKHPSQFASMISALETFEDANLSMVLVNGSNSEKNKTMLLVSYEFYLPEATVLVKDEQKSYNSRLSLFNEKSSVNNASSVYLCLNNSCQAPITSAAELKNKLANY